MLFLLSKTNFSFENVSRNTKLHETSLASHSFIASDGSSGDK